MGLHCVLSEFIHDTNDYKLQLRHFFLNSLNHGSYSGVMLDLATLRLSKSCKQNHS